MTIIQGGAIANKSGRDLENQVELVVRQHGYAKLNEYQKKQFVRSDGVLTTHGSKWYTTQCRLEENVYGAKSTSDLILYCTDKFPELLHIEVKWQKSSGSVDEKYVFTVMSLLGFSGDKILILDGGGARQGAVRWVRGNQKPKNRFKVMTFMEFYSWARDNL